MREARCKRCSFRCDSAFHSMLRSIDDPKLMVEWSCPACQLYPMPWHASDEVRTPAEAPPHCCATLPDPSLPDSYPSATPTATPLPPPLPPLCNPSATPTATRIPTALLPHCYPTATPLRIAPPPIQVGLRLKGAALMNGKDGMGKRGTQLWAADLKGFWAETNGNVRTEKHDPTCHAKITYFLK